MAEVLFMKFGCLNSIYFGVYGVPIVITTCELRFFYFVFLYVTKQFFIIMD